jgi:hypothetical protein
MPDVVPAVCASCGALQSERFCERCGEKRITTHDYSIVHFGETLVETLTHFDIRSVRALKLLVVRPGALTRAYLDGQRRAYVGPIQLFVILNIVFAFFGANTFRTPLAVQQQSWMPEVKQRMVASAKARKATSDEEFEREFDRTAGLQAKTWVFSMIPAYAICLAVLYGFRRYFFEHLVFATHFVAFVLIWILAAGIPLNLMFRAAGIAGNAQRDQIISLVLLLGMVGYLFLALRRVYGDGIILGAARSLALVVLFLPILRAYRLLLFFVTLKTMH